MNERRHIDRVLQIHTRYRHAGGEDQLVEAERRLLQAGGVEVDQVIFDNAELRESVSLISDVRLAAMAVWSRAAARRVSAAIAAVRPDVVHVHNTFSAASPSVYVAASGRDVPVVQTLHNYRLVCPAATALRDGHPCTDCVGRLVPWPAIVHACVRGSRPQSAAAAATLLLHRARGTFDRDIDAYIALTEFQRDLVIAGGLPGDRIRVVPNFLDPDPGAGDGRRAGILFVGRLMQDKGISVLIEAAALLPGVVRVIGSGPLAPSIELAASRGEITYAGRIPHDSVQAELRKAMALVLPSIWYEGFPLVVLEAFASGTPVIASRLGSLAEIVEDGSTGLLAEANSAADLGARIRWALDHEAQMREMGLNARRAYEQRFGGQTHLAALMEVYLGIGAGSLGASAPPSAPADRDHDGGAA
jgi:glycosyltransferase involved in cell wall biosynthesis